MASNEAVFKVVVEEDRSRPATPQPSGQSHSQSPIPASPMTGVPAKSASEIYQLLPEESGKKTKRGKPAPEIYGFEEPAYQELAPPDVRRTPLEAVTKSKTAGDSSRYTPLSGIEGSRQGSTSFAGNDISAMFSSLLSGLAGGKSPDQQEKDRAGREAKLLQIDEAKRQLAEERELNKQKTEEERRILREKRTLDRGELLARAASMEEIQALNARFKKENREGRKQEKTEDANEEALYRRRLQYIEDTAKREEQAARKQMMFQIGDGAVRSVGRNAETIGRGMYSEAGGAATVAGTALSAFRDVAAVIPGWGQKVAAAFQIAEAGVKLFTAAQDQAARNMVHFGKTASQVVSNDLMGARRAQVQKEIDEKGATPIIGAIRVWMSGLKKELAGIDAFQSVRGAAKQEGERLAPWSGAISAASAQANVTKMMADRRSAQGSEGAIANFVSTNARFEAALQRIADTQKSDIYRRIAQAQESGEVSQGLFEQLKKLENVQDLLKTLNSNTKEGNEMRKRIAKDIAEMKKSEQDLMGASIMKGLQEGLDLLPEAMPNERGGGNDVWGEQQMMQPLGR